MSNSESKNKEPEIKAPKYYEPIDDQVPYCPLCGVKFTEPVAANYDYVCPACDGPFNVVKSPEEESGSDKKSESDE